MTRLESRPTGEAMGSYCFSIDFEGHVQDARVGETLMGLRRVCAEVRFLGSYPRADQREMVRKAARRGCAFGFKAEGEGGVRGGETGEKRKCEAVMKGAVVEASFAKGEWGVRWREKM